MALVVSPATFMISATTLAWSCWYCFLSSTCSAFSELSCCVVNRTPSFFVSSVSNFLLLLSNFSSWQKQNNSKFSHHKLQHPEGRGLLQKSRSKTALYKWRYQKSTSYYYKLGVNINGTRKKSQARLKSDSGLLLFAFWHKKMTSAPGIEWVIYGSGIL